MDVAVEMVHVGNALSEEDMETVDTDAVVVPDFFGHIRPLLCQTDGSPRLLVRVMPALVVYAFVAMALFINYMFGTVIPIATGGEPMAPLVRVMVLGWVAIFSLPGLFIPMLCRVIRVGY